VNLDQIIELIDGEILIANENPIEYDSAFASDLMSDVLRWHCDNMILITGLATIQTIRTAELSGIYCVILARGKKVSDEMLEIAGESDIAILTSPKSMFEISGILYQEGIKPLY